MIKKLLICVLTIPVKRVLRYVYLLYVELDLIYVGMEGIDIFINENNKNSCKESKSQCPTVSACHVTLPKRCPNGTCVGADQPCLGESTYCPFQCKLDDENIFGN